MNRQQIVLERRLFAEHSSYLQASLECPHLNFYSDIALFLDCICFALNVWGISRDFTTGMTTEQRLSFKKQKYIKMMNRFYSNYFLYVHYIKRNEKSMQTWQQLWWLDVSNRFHRTVVARELVATTNTQFRTSHSQFKAFFDP